MQFLNVEYILIAFYNAFQGLPASGITLQTIPGTIHVWTTRIMDFGAGLTLVLLAVLIYAHLRLEQIQADAKHRRHDAVDEYAGKHSVRNVRWEHVKELMMSASQTDWRAAIVEADIMLFEMLAALGVPGDTIGDQLKSINRTSFNTIDLAWDAHKIRNEIAHAGSAYVLTEREARRAIDFYRQAFEEFGYI
jgi:hypothetical protein